MSVAAPQTPGGVLTYDTIQSLKALQGGQFSEISASGAVTPTASDLYIITKAGVAALTLAAPVSGTASQGGDDGVTITILSSTANAHTLTSTGNFGDGAGNTDLATFAAEIGAGVTLIAYGGTWIVANSVGITM